MELSVEAPGSWHLPVGPNGKVFAELAQAAALRVFASDGRVMVFAKAPDGQLHLIERDWNENDAADGDLVATA